MAVTKYSYAKLCASDRLQMEISAAAITIALDRIETVSSPAGTDIWFKDALPEGQETTLTALVTAHSGLPLPVSDEKRNAKGALVVDVSTELGLPGAESITLNTHDWSDRTTWYQRSVQVTNELLTDSVSGITFSSAHPWWINMDSMNLTYDYESVPERDGVFSDRALRRPVVTSDGVAMNLCVNKAMSTSGDYSVNFETGQVTFYMSQAGKEVRATYYHNDGVARRSEWILNPPANKVYLLKYVEIQFSKTIEFSSGIHIDIWAGGNAYGPVPDVYGDFDQETYDAGFGQNKSFYRGPKDFMNICTNRASQVIPAFGGMLHDMLVFPFDYLVNAQIRSDQGAIIMMYLEDDVPFANCELSTCTLYMQLVPGASL